MKIIKVYTITETKDLIFNELVRWFLPINIEPFDKEYTELSQITEEIYSEIKDRKSIYYEELMTYAIAYCKMKLSDKHDS